MPAEPTRPVRVPPRWFVTTFWRGHRALLRLSGGRVGLWRPGGRRGWGALRLTTTGRRSGRSRTVVLGYLDDGPDLLLLAMNGWGEGHPAWFHNLVAERRVTVERRGTGSRPMTAHVATGAERERVWERWREVDPRLDEYAALRTTPAPVVVLSPAPSD
ncbi:MAG: nitroreductase family deazaflavin-dependent oxidoreductase [Phycicoccus sp.]